MCPLPAYASLGLTLNPPSTRDIDFTNTLVVVKFTNTALCAFLIAGNIWRRKVQPRCQKVVGGEERLPSSLECYHGSEFQCRSPLSKISLRHASMPSRKNNAAGQKRSALWIITMISAPPANWPLPETPACHFVLPGTRVFVDQKYIMFGWVDLDCRQIGNTEAWPVGSGFAVIIPMSLTATLDTINAARMVHFFPHPPLPPPCSDSIENLSPFENNCQRVIYGSR